MVAVTFPVVFNARWKARCRSTGEPAALPVVCSNTQLLPEEQSGIPRHLQDAFSPASLIGGRAITLWHPSDRRVLADRRRIVIRLAAACVHVRSGLWRREGRQDRLPRARQILVGRAGGPAPPPPRSTLQRPPHH